MMVSVFFRNVTLGLGARSDAWEDFKNFFVCKEINEY